MFLKVVSVHRYSRALKEWFETKFAILYTQYDTNWHSCFDFHNVPIPAQPPKLWLASQFCSTGVSKEGNRLNEKNLKTRIMWEVTVLRLKSKLKLPLLLNFFSFWLKVAQKLQISTTMQQINTCSCKSVGTSGLSTCYLSDLLQHKRA